MAVDRRRVLLVGATGLIGSAIAARLAGDGWTVRAVVRGDGPAERRLCAHERVRLDLRHAVQPENWHDALQNVDAIVNAAGLLQDGGTDAIDAVQATAPAALWRACEELGVRRVVHLSAMGAEKTPLSDFSATKQAAEHALAASALDWVILRPSVVVGRAAYGGSALFRGLAALPFALALPGAGQIQVVQLDDVVETVAQMVRPDAPRGIALDIGGPERLTFEEVVAQYREWLGWRPARQLRMPGWLMGAAYWLGDIAGRLGWRPPIRSTARKEMARGAVADVSEWISTTGIRPRSLGEALAAEPASVQERWFARLYLLKPLVFVVFAAFWLATALMSVGPGYGIAAGLMREGGGGALSEPSVWAGALADLAIGLGILHRRTAKPALLAALAISVFYILAGSSFSNRSRLYGRWISNFASRAAGRLVLARAESVRQIYDRFR